MKKLFLSLAVAATATSAFAQTDLSHSVLLYGEGGFRSTHGSDRISNSGISSSTDRPRTREYIVAPGVGFAVNKHITIGVNGSYTGSKLDLDKKGQAAGFNYETKMREFQVGPFIRYTQMLGEHFFVFGQLNVNYMNGKETNYYYLTSGPNSSTEDTYNGVNASYFPAVGVMFSKSAALSFNIGGIGYQYQKYDFDNNGVPGLEQTSKRSEFALSMGQQFNLGIQKYFGCGRGKMKGHHQMMDDTRMMDTSDDNDESDMPKRKSRKNDDD